MRRGFFLLTNIVFKNGDPKINFSLFFIKISLLAFFSVFCYIELSPRVPSGYGIGTSI